MVTTLGVVSAASTWLMEMLNTLDGFFRLVATVAGAGVAVLTLMIKVRTWRDSRRPPKEPADVDDQIPL